MTDVYTWDAIHEATRRFVRAVDALPDEAYAEPSALPGWSRGFVVAHVALNAEGMARVMHGLVVGDGATMYDSQKARDEAIDELGGASPSQVRDRLLSATTVFQDAWEHMTDEAWAGDFRRMPEADPWAASSLGRLRLIELEVHHADLEAGYSAGHWREQFLDALFNRVVGDRQAGPPMLLRTPDGDVPVGEGGPVVSGSRADLTWWLLGRGEGQGLTGDPSLPTLGPWR